MNDGKKQKELLIQKVGNIEADFTKKQTVVEVAEILTSAEIWASFVTYTTTFKIVCLFFQRSLEIMSSKS